MNIDQSIDVRVTAIEEITPLIKRFTLEAADGGALPAFSGGAHIVVELADGDVVHRNPYSLVGSPWDRRRYCIAVRRSESGRGGSRYLHDQVATGAALRISAPVNLFPLAESRGKHLFVAGGVGVAPFFAHLAELAARGVPHELHYAVRSAEHAGLAGEIVRRYGECLRLYLAEAGQAIDFAELFRAQPADTELYVCGPDGLVEAALAAARAAGWAEARLHAEPFAAPEGAGFIEVPPQPGERLQGDETTPTLTDFAEGRLCTAGPFGGREAMLREFPASPPPGGAQWLRAAGRH